MTARRIVRCKACNADVHITGATADVFDDADGRQMFRVGIKLACSHQVEVTVAILPRAGIDVVFAFMGAEFAHQLGKGLTDGSSSENGGQG